MDNQEIDKILKESRTIAMVGLSPKPDRPSYQVAQYLKDKGYRIVPVHPQADTILGEPVYRRLEEIPPDIAIDVVDVFRKSDDTPPIAESAVRIRAKTLWLQLGVVNDVAEAIALSGGLSVVMDKCLKREHERYEAQSREG